MRPCPLLSPCLVAAALLITSLGASPHVALAYTIKNELSAGCHEEITTAALRTVRSDGQTAPPLPATSDEQALIGDLQFVPDPDMQDLGGATLLMAVRDNDLKGRSSDDLTQLAFVHGNPDAQDEHCLRSASEDEPGGTQAAIADCQAFILGRIAEAIAGLDANGQPDPTNRTTLTVHLSLRGQVNAPLPTYYVRMGQAIHAIEDSFTHTYRTPDSTKITVTLNWIDKVGGNLVESRDGPAHAAQLDRCDDPDALRTARHALALKAAVGVLTATLDPTTTSDQKMTAAGAVLTTYLSYSPGCTYDNGWCDAPERAYADPSCGCHVGKVGGTLGAMIAAGVVVFIAAARRARRRSRRRLAGALAATAALVLATSNARAQSTASPPSTEPTTKTSTTPSATVSTTTIPGSTPATPPTTATTVTKPLTTTTILTAPTQPDEHAPPPPKVVPVPEPGPRDPSAMAWGGFLGGSASISNPAVAGSAGVRLRASKSWAFGLDGEWNPWLALNGNTFHASVVNVYGTAILRLPLAYENFNLRSTVSLGTSYLLSSLYGAPSGSLGLYGGVSFLGLEWKVSRAFFAIIDPLGVVLPVPQLKGIPLTYPQYRFTLGLEFYLG
jgi:type II secretory pathway pseudopilin PulG